VSCGRVTHSTHIGAVSCKDCQADGLVNDGETLYICASKALEFLTSLGIYFTQEMLLEQARQRLLLRLPQVSIPKLKWLPSVLHVIPLAFFKAERIENNYICTGNTSTKVADNSAYVAAVEVRRSMCMTRCTGTLVHEFLHVWICLRRSLTKTGMAYAMGRNQEAHDREESFCYAASIYFWWRSNNALGKSLVKKFQHSSKDIPKVLQYSKTEGWNIIVKTLADFGQYKP
jgi:hypothetical protein